MWQVLKCCMRSATAHVCSVLCVSAAGGLKLLCRRWVWSWTSSLCLLNKWPGSAPRSSTALKDDIYEPLTFMISQPSVCRYTFIITSSHALRLKPDVSKTTNHTADFKWAETEQRASDPLSVFMQLRLQPARYFNGRSTDGFSAVYFPISSQHSFYKFLWKFSSFNESYKWVWSFSTGSLLFCTGSNYEDI